MHTRGAVLLGYLWIVTAAAAAEPWMLGPFTRPAGVNPVLSPRAETRFDCPMRGRPVRWESKHTFNPAAVVRDGMVQVLYRAEDDTGSGIGGHTSRLGLAVSHDGVHFERRPTPVFYPDRDAQSAREWDGGCEDPRLVEAEDGRYVLTYTQWNHRIPRLAIATSRDLVHWTKQGPAFARASGGYVDRAHKSGAIVCRQDGDRLVAARIGGRYWMYWGEGGVAAATSEDLVDWRPVEDGGRLRVVLENRPGCFDSELAESGPPPIVTPRGIVMLYNGKNAPRGGDRTLGPGAYAGGQALLDARDPTRVLERPRTPFFRPEAAFEKTGQYTDGTTFLEALVPFRGQWFMYYGCADSLVGVAVAPDAPSARAGTRLIAGQLVAGQLVAGQDAWTLASDRVSLAVTRLGAQVAPVTFFRDEAHPIAPFYVSPWQGTGARFPDVPVLEPLRGDFFCMPFGGNGTPYQGERHPPHGETAGSPWTLARSQRDGPVKSLTLTLQPRVRAGTVTRKLALVDGQNVLYQRTVVRGFAGATSVAHHAILAMPAREGALLVSVKPFYLGMTAPYRFSDPAKGEYQSLAIGAAFTSLARVPSIFRETPPADCSAFPARRGFADLLETFAAPGSREPDWLTAVDTDQHWLYFALKDPRVLPGRVYWIENHGRHGAPWSGRNACLGVEDACAFFDAGLAESAGSNAVNARGIATSHELSAAAPLIVHTIQGVVRVPPGFGRVADVRLDPGQATFVSHEGMRVTAPVYTTFLSTGSLPGDQDPAAR